MSHIQNLLVKCVKLIFGISDLTLYVRRKKQDIEKLFYHQKYTADDIVSALKELGVKPGRPLIIHSAMHNFYNYKGTAEELIDAIIEYIGSEGTLCMPAFMKDKTNEKKIFDIKNSKSAAGYLTEAFRKYPGVKRSLNQLESVCALGKDAEKITGEHYLSRISFDEHSPFYIIGQLRGYSVNLGMPKWFVGTGEHVCEALLYDKMIYFKDKFSTPVEFSYIDWQKNVVKHTMLTRSKHSYVREKSTSLFDKYFDKTKYGRKKVSNIWVTVYDMKYLYETLYSLAEQGITIFKEPKFYR
uniref:AAC(3) family N-acetyltransferase n=1 Tax=Parabacteroides distasonis TaxID=823 RepID=UPI004025FF04